MLKIFTPVVNNPIFIEIQYHTLKKYMKCDYEFIVFNDAKSFPDFTNGGDISIREKIQKTCENLNIECINIDNSDHSKNKNSAIRCADANNFILNFQKENPNYKYLVIDSDMFLISDFYGSEFDSFDCAIVLQERSPIKYFWNGIYYFDFTRMQNKNLLNWNCQPTTDVGGMMEKWLLQKTNNIPSVSDIRYTSNKYHNDGIYYIKHLWSCSWDNSEMPNHLNQKIKDFIKTDPRNLNGKYFCEIYDNLFLHYRAGGNWRNEGIDFHKNLSTKLYETLVNED
jgi:hypothetical protein